MRLPSGVCARSGAWDSGVRGLAVALICGGLSTACINSPSTNEVIDTTRQPIEFKGLLPSAFGSSVKVQYLTNNLVWANLGTTSATRGGTWQLSAAVPANGWLQPCGTAVVRALSNQNQTLL